MQRRARRDRCGCARARVASHVRLSVSARVARIETCLMCTFRATVEPTRTIKRRASIEGHRDERARETSCRPTHHRKEGHVMTSRRAASIASRFSSRFSSRYSARLSPPLAPPTPRLRWAAALAVAYLAVAGCAARATTRPPRRQLPSRHRRLRPRLPSPPRARCCRRRASSTATCSSRCRPRSSIPTRRPSSTRRPMAIRRRSCSCISNRNRSRASR